MNILEREDVMGFLSGCGSTFCNSTILSNAMPFEQRRNIERRMVHTDAFYVDHFSKRRMNIILVMFILNVHISTVMYLKIPKYLPTKKSHRPMMMVQFSLYSIMLQEIQLGKYHL